MLMFPTDRRNRDGSWKQEEIHYDEIIIFWCIRS